MYSFRAATRRCVRLSVSYLLLHVLVFIFFSMNTQLHTEGDRWRVTRTIDTRPLQQDVNRPSYPRGERVPAGAGLARLAGGRGAGGGAAQADGAVEAVLALVQHRVRRRGARHAGAARHRRGAAVQPQPHRDGRVAPPAPRARARAPRPARAAPLMDAII